MPAMMVPPIKGEEWTPEPFLGVGEKHITQKMDWDLLSLQTYGY